LVAVDLAHAVDQTETVVEVEDPMATYAVRIRGCLAVIGVIGQVVVDLNGVIE